ncbi:hypothetical protein AGLY_014136 [Aphis glycines]|uniref:Uncharacterized protein n=1 Tax=Aphis glycines TaxID=307491 RepID=A0A6G0T4V6_APHGL|nr:hypothetical protein AGLY_014136 [Aphis glycines]
MIKRNFVLRLKDRSITSSNLQPFDDYIIRTSKRLSKNVLTVVLWGKIPKVYFKTLAKYNECLNHFFKHMEKSRSSLNHKSYKEKYNYLCARMLLISKICILHTYICPLYLLKCHLSEQWTYSLYNDVCYIIGGFKLHIIFKNKAQLNDQPLEAKEIILALSKRIRKKKVMHYKYLIKKIGYLLLLTQIILKLFQKFKVEYPTIFDCNRQLSTRGKIQIKDKPVFNRQQKLEIVTNILYYSYSYVSHSTPIVYRLLHPLANFIISRNSASISNFGGDFQWQSEYPWCIMEVKKSISNGLFK